MQLHQPAHDAENFLSANRTSQVGAGALQRPQTRALVERHRIAYHEKKLGQLFCDGSSRQIIEMLLAECAAARVEVRTTAASRRSERIRLQLKTSRGGLRAESLVIASGGLSIPKIGRAISVPVARQFG